MRRTRGLFGSGGEKKSPHRQSRRVSGMHNTDGYTHFEPDVCVLSRLAWWLPLQSSRGEPLQHGGGRARHHSVRTYGPCATLRWLCRVCQCNVPRVASSTLFILVPCTHLQAHARTFRNARIQPHGGYLIKLRERKTIDFLFAGLKAALARRQKSGPEVPQFHGLRGGSSRAT